MRRFIALLPVIIFAILVTCLAIRLFLIDQGNTPNIIPSVMVGRAAPSFILPSVFQNQPNLTSANFQNKITLVNIFASWCLPCRIEHPILGTLKKTGIAMIGIDYKDQGDDARAWLDKMGNPYDAVGADTDGQTAINFGAYGVPESYLIDQHGMIRFKQIGPLTPDIIRRKLLPLIRKLQK